MNVLHPKDPAGVVTSASKSKPVSTAQSVTKTAPASTQTTTATSSSKKTVQVKTPLWRPETPPVTTTQFAHKVMTRFTHHFHTIFVYKVFDGNIMQGYDSNLAMKNPHQGFHKVYTDKHVSHCIVVVTRDSRHCHRHTSATSSIPGQTTTILDLVASIKSKVLSWTGLLADGFKCDVIVFGIDRRDSYSKWRQADQHVVTARGVCLALPEKKNLNQMALRGIKVLEIAGLAPAPFCGMVLADFGASVVRVDRAGPAADVDVLSNGKRSIAINLKSPKGVDVFQKLCKNTDVLIEPFRKGVMERLGLGPNVLMEMNPKLVYARLSGFGHKGVYSEKAGHDINYVAMSGVLSLLGGEAKRPTPPVNLAADFGGGGLMCALGIVLALNARTTLHRGQVVDCDMVGGTAYLASWLIRSQNTPLLWGQPRGHNLLDGGAHFYTTYETRDGRWLAVGALEPQFYQDLLQGLGLPDVPQFPDNYEECKKIFAGKFKEKTQDEWIKIFEPLDACVTPVLSLSEAAAHPHNTANESFLPSSTEGEGEGVLPCPAPRLSLTPGERGPDRHRPHVGQHTRQVLSEAGVGEREVEALLREGVVKCGDSKL